MVYVCVPVVVVGIPALMFGTVVICSVERFTFVVSYCSNVVVVYVNCNLLVVALSNMLILNVSVAF